MAEAARAAAHPVLRRPGGWLLLLAVTLLHLLAADELVSDRFGWGANERPVPRIEVAFVRELQQAAPPVAAPKPPEPKRPAARALPTVAQRPAEVASAPAATAPPEPVPTPEPIPPPVLAEAPRDEPPPTREVQPPQLPVAEASAPAATAPAVAGAAASGSRASFDWPPSTRLSYAVEGFFRGPMPPGRAQVDWLHSGSRYQVHLEVSAGPLTRRASSEGELTAKGLEPRRFEGNQRVMFSAKRWTQQFEPERIVLGDGSALETQSGVQDEASQFVQLTWLFTTQPQLLQVGRSVEIPLMINRRLDRWIYDIKEQRTLSLPFGDVPTYYIKPRREARPGTMVAEIWIAPSLQYLPVRILIRQAEDAYADLTLEKPPMQATGETGR